MELAGRVAAVEVEAERLDEQAHRDDRMAWPCAAGLKWSSRVT